MRMDRNSLDGFVNDFVAVTVEGLLDGGGGAQSKKGRNEPLVDLCWGGGEKKRRATQRGNTHTHTSTNGRLDKEVHCRWPAASYSIQTILCPPSFLLETICDGRRGSVASVVDDLIVPVVSSGDDDDER